LEGGCDVKDPAKIILTGSGQLNPENDLLRQTTEGEVYILTSLTGEKKMKGKIRNPRCRILIVPEVQGRLSLISGLKILKKNGIHHLLVEGGPSVFAQFLSRKLFQVLHLFIAPKIFGGHAHSFSGDAVLSSINAKPYLQWECFTLLGKGNESTDMYVRYGCLQESFKS
jgi:diaminohydroxyphosphoribosylaminopyrimidine deaminase / 5-amino-6-(5-phosphoribosylamino)uracil reductase